MEIMNHTLQRNNVRPLCYIILWFKLKAKCNTFLWIELAAGLNCKFWFRVRFWLKKKRESDLCEQEWWKLRSLEKGRGHVNICTLQFIKNAPISWNSSSHLIFILMDNMKTFNIKPNLRLSHALYIMLYF